MTLGTVDVHILPRHSDLYILWNLEAVMGRLVPPTTVAMACGPAQPNQILIVEPKWNIPAYDEWDTVRDLNHELLHLVLNHIGERDASSALDNLEGYVGMDGLFRREVA